MLPGIRYGVVAAALLLGGCDMLGQLPLGANYVAKNVCNGLYVSGYDADPLLNDYVTHVIPNLQSIWEIETDATTQTVTVGDKFRSDYQVSAIHRPPLGCVNVGQSDAETLRQQVPQALSAPTLSPTEPWPRGNAGVSVDHLPDAVVQALENRLDEEYVDDANTVATLIIHQGQLVHERYTSGLTADAPLKGYSMSKSVVNALAGLLYDRGLLALEQPTGFVDWQGDQRSEITPDQLLRMTSGLAHHESAAGKHNDQAGLLYGIQQDPVAYALSKPLAQREDGTGTVEPGSLYNYSSQDNLLAAKLIQDTLGGMQATYDVYQRDLFHAINITTAVVEHGRDQYLLSPEGVMMSARDWARLGLLYLNDGVSDGRQILSRQWLGYTFTPTEQNISYGAGIALNTGKYLLPDVPEDAFAFLGAWERYVVVIPSADVIVVRMGFSQPDQRERINRLVADILAVL